MLMSMANTFETVFWHVADDEWGEYEKRLGPGSQWKENGGSFDRAGGTGRPVSLSPLIKSKFGWLFG